MNLTIKSVSPTPREWNSPQFPDGCSVRVYFTDGSVGELNTKKASAQKHIDALNAQVGKPGEFEIVKEREYQGTTERTFKQYPGKQESGGFGGGRQWQPAWSQSKEGVEYHEERTDRRTSLMQGVIAAGPGAAPEAVWFHMKAYYKLLRNNLGSIVQNDPKPSETPLRGNEGPRNGESNDPFE